MEKRAHPGRSADPALSIRFGPFELDLRGRELRKEGRRIRLQEQPFQILRMLLESPGEVVSREEIRKRLWPDDTVVEFDHSINAAVNRLRDALRDSADKPRYIETLARRGYRFVGEVEAADRSTPAEPVTVVPQEPVSVVPQNDLTNRQAEPAPRRPRLHLRPRIFVPVLLAITILMVWAGAGYYRRGTRLSVAPLQPLMRLDVDLGSQVSPGSERGAYVILAPDGTRLVYVSHSKLFTRRLDQANATELPGTENAEAPFFSPDGQWVAFFAREKLRKISTGGGRVIELCEARLGGGGGGNWGEDGNIVAAVDYVLSRIPAAGGTLTPLTELRQGEIVHRWPQVLQGGKAVLFSAYASMSGLDSANIEVMSLENRRRKTVVRGGTWGRYLTSGHLVYINKGTLFAVPFDSDRLEVHGTPIPVLEGVAYSAAWGSAQIDFSRNGTLVYRSSRAGNGLVTVQWLDEPGNTSPLLPVPGNYLSPALSPDGNRLALTSSGDIWVYDLKRATMVRLTFGGGYGNPLWTADSQYIVFRAAGGIWWILAGGTGHPEPLIQSSNPQLPWSFTPDGKRLAFVEIDPGTGADIWTVPVERDGLGLRAGKPEVFLQTPFQERAPMFSPDGRWLAYFSNESGTFRVYVQAFPQKGGKRQISGDSSGYPAWSRNGDELFFWQFGGDKQLMVASYKARGDSFLPDKPRVWSKKIVDFPTTRSYDPAPDGKRIVALMPAETPQEPPGHVIFLLNFFDELRRRVQLSAD
jgi:eukaryotic-like serine/threonine-protein kinase